MFSSPFDRRPIDEETGKLISAKIIGSSYDVAKAFLDQHQIYHRVMSVDGNSFAGTTNYVPDRANLTITTGISAVQDLDGLLRLVEEDPRIATVTGVDFG